MILTDAGPLVALIDRGDRDHAACDAALDQITLPMVTTSPAFTEAMYLLGRFCGWNGQSILWSQVASSNLELVDITGDLLDRTRALMSKYADRPMDLADASLIALAERDDHKRIFTLDSDFGIYRTHSRRSLQVIPARP